MALGSMWRTAPRLCPRKLQYCRQLHPKLKTDREGTPQRVQWNLKAPFDLSASSVCTPSGVQAAVTKLWLWQRWLSLWCLCGNVFFLYMRQGEAWGQTPRPTDRQTAGSPASQSWNRSRFSQEVVAHWDASLLRRNKVGFKRHKHPGREKCGVN